MGSVGNFTIAQYFVFLNLKDMLQNHFGGKYGCMSRVIKTYFARKYLILIGKLSVILMSIYMQEDLLISYLT